MQNVSVIPVDPLSFKTASDDFVLLLEQVENGTAEASVIEPYVAEVAAKTGRLAFPNEYKGVKYNQTGIVVFEIPERASTDSAMIRVFTKSDNPKVAIIPRQGS